MKSNLTVYTVSITTNLQQGLPLAKVVTVYGNVEKAFLTLQELIGKAIFNKFNIVHKKLIASEFLKIYQTFYWGNNTKLEPRLPEDFSTHLVYFLSLCQ